MPKEALQSTLIDGYRRFRDGRYQAEKDLFEDLGLHGQHPKVMVIACCDSRVDPAEIFDTKPGDIFVLRNVANMVPASQDEHIQDSAHCAIDYAVNVLGVRLIMIMGHEKCGGIGAAIAGMGNNPNTPLKSWIAQINTSRDVVFKDFIESERQIALEYESIRQSIRNVLSMDDVKAKVQTGDLAVMGAHFSIEKGRLSLMNDDGDFIHM